MPEMSELLWNEKHGCVCARSREVHRYRQNRSGCGGRVPHRLLFWTTCLNAKLGTELPSNFHLMPPPG
jgi:hypothetical protein